jgi:hypothetical protein
MLGYPVGFGSAVPAGSVSENVLTPRGAIGAVRRAIHRAMTMAATASALTAAVSGDSLRRCGAGCSPPLSLMRNCATAMSPIRLVRSLWSERANKIRMFDGVSTGSASHSGSRFNTLASVSLIASPPNARLPVSIS